MKTLKNLYLKLFHYFARKQEAVYFDKLEDISTYSWWQVLEFGDLNFILKYGEIDEHAQKHFDKLENDYIDLFGVSDSFTKIFYKTIQINLLRIKLAKTKDLFINTNIAILEIELKNLQDKQKIGTFDKMQNVRAIEKYRGFKFDIKKESIVNFHGYLADIKKEIEWKKR